MSKRKLRQMYRKYLYSYTFEAVEVGKSKPLKKYDPKISFASMQLKK
jgi:hypothetical protein